MSKLIGVFQELSFLENTPIENISAWVKEKIDPHRLENYLASRLFYPQTVPATPQEINIDLAILREALRVNNRLLYDPEKNRFEVSTAFINRFGSLSNIILSFLDVTVMKKGVVYIYLKETNRQPIGTILTPEIPPDIRKVLVRMSLNVFELETGKAHILEAREPNYIISLNNMPQQVIGGLAGVIVNLK